MKTINVCGVKIGARRGLTVIAGPCVIEGERPALYHARRIRDICRGHGVGFIFKSSYDKANRSSIKSFRGPGLREGLKILSKVRERLGVPVLSDVHCRRDIEAVKDTLDIIQIPAFLCRQTDFVVEAAGTGKVINIKKGQFLAPWEVKNIIEKIESTGNKKIIVTERGTMFGYNNLVSDFRALGIMRQFGYPVFYDATHSVQLPGGRGCASGGERRFVPMLARAAVAAGCEGLFLEVHISPDKAPCDGPNMIDFKEFGKLLSQVVKIERALGRW